MELKGKKINFIGDSITEGARVENPENVYPAILKRTLGLAEASACITDGWHIFYIHLPLNPQLRRCIIRLWFSPLFRRWCFGRIAKSDEYTIQRSWMSGISFFCAKFSIKFAYRDVRIATMKVPDPFEFLLCVSVRMRSFWTMGFIKQGGFRAIEFFIPTHQR